MEDNLKPRPSANPGPVTRRPMDDFSATPTPRPMSIPVSSPPEDSKNDTDSLPETEGMSLSELNSKIADDIANEPTVKEPVEAPISNEPELHTPESPMADKPSEDISAKPEAVPVPINIEKDEPEEKKELIPGLNTKPEEDAFKDTPVSLSDTSEEVTPDIDLNNPANKSNVGVVTSAQYDKSNKKGRGMAIIVAILLAIALIAGAGYAYLQNSKETTPPATTNTTVTPQVKETTPAEDIDSLNTQIDDSLKAVNDTTDYQENDLTDTTLGL